MDGRRRWSWLVWLWVAFSAVVGFADVLDVTAPVPAPTGNETAVVLRLYGLVLALTISVAGALVFWKRPENRIGWFLLLGSVYFPASAFSSLIRPLVGPDLEPWAAWGQQAFWSVSIPPLVVFVPLLFPDGRLPSPRWRWVAWVAGTGIALLGIGNTVSPDLLEYDGLVNPASFPGAGQIAEVTLLVGGAGFVFGFLAAVVSIGVRFRRSEGVRRLQMRWLFAGAGGALAGWLVAMTFELSGQQEFGSWFFATGFTLIPVAVTVAVLRYRLYEIERIVSRTVSYSATVLLLAVLYASSVVGLGALLRGLAGESSGDLVVAASTLVVAAAFGPVRRRVQGQVNRRFDRARYDAVRTVEAFSNRLRDQIELGAVASGLVAVASETMHPDRVSLWLAPSDVDSASVPSAT